jgi:hypothetical protein
MRAAVVAALIPSSVLRVIKACARVRSTISAMVG